MAPDDTPAWRRAWIEQWRRAGGALEEARRRELRELTDAQALAASEALLSLGAATDPSPRRREHSGLVELQALLHS